ncbi:hypothetical protein SAMN02745163_01329 [Clostridium cavendishii DSM 21758]|uniref:DUF4159 domain-containing protein n=1 Tax=Clostridium cavendishii DSM 21758 TaxID=1121302 RepID=A0A1M6GMQ8_9CLOT|nr:hypothetical protein [Clostridium cavendishii]SHJ11192.1 hypothetical protein SAMN02745163_01329 [Clostridium cavendishii DSM 21758]
MLYDSTKPVEESVETEKTEVSEPKVLDPRLRGIIRVYQNSIPWNNRSNATLLSLGKVLGVDYFIHPISDLINEVPLDTTVVLISSNSIGSEAAATEENNAIVQRNLYCFVNRGGVLIVDMADNLKNGGYTAPGSYGTPDYIFPDYADGYKLFLTPKSYCSTFVNGPTITLTDENIDMDPNTRWSAHGNLQDGIIIPKSSKILMTTIFGGIQKPVLAYYCLGNGFVIVDTITKEFYGQNPAGVGPSNILTNLFYFAYNLSKLCFC